MRIGILGCGGVAHRWYLPGLSGSRKDYELVCVADIDKVKAKEAAEKYGIPDYCVSLEELIKKRPDLVVVLTRHSDHYDHIKGILDSGIHVYSEKPFVEDIDKGKGLISLAKHKGLMLGAAPQVMLSSRNRTVKEFISSGKIGKVLFARVSCSNMGPGDRRGIDFDPRWFYMDGGSVESLGIYNLAAIMWIMGTPLRVAGLSGISYKERAVMHGPFKGEKFTVKSPDNEVAMLDYGEGTFVLFDGSYSVMTPPRWEFEIHGTKGSLFAGGFGGQESVMLKLREQDEEYVGPDDDCHINWNLSWGVEETIKAIKEKRETPTNAEFALDTIKVIQALRDSSEKGEYIKIK